MISLVALARMPSFGSVLPRLKPGCLVSIRNASDAAVRSSPHCYGGTEGGYRKGTEGGYRKGTERGYRKGTERGYRKGTERELSAVIVKSTIRSATGALVTQLLRPLMMKCVPASFSTARLAILPASLPDIGSVKL